MEGEERPKEGQLETGGRRRFVDMKKKETEARRVRERQQKWTETILGERRR